MSEHTHPAVALPPTITVTFTDGRQEAVAIRDLPIGDLPEYWKRIEDEPACVELFTGHESGWAATLGRESFEAVLEAGEERNLDFLLRFSQRAARRREKIMPGMEARLIESLARTLAAASPPSAAS